MPARLHRHTVHLTWSGNTGSGTSSYRGYGRRHLLQARDKPPIPTSADPAFRGDHDCWNPEELLVGALSACHQLWYLHLCADASLVGVAYEDNADGVMIEETGGEGSSIG